MCVKSGSENFSLNNVSRLLPSLAVYIDWDPIKLLLENKQHDAIIQSRYTSPVLKIIYISLVMLFTLIYAFK